MYSNGWRVSQSVFNKPYTCHNMSEYVFQRIWIGIGMYIGLRKAHTYVCMYARVNIHTHTRVCTHTHTHAYSSNIAHLSHLTFRNHGILLFFSNRRLTNPLGTYHKTFPFKKRATILALAMANVPSTSSCALE